MPTLVVQGAGRVELEEEDEEEEEEDEDGEEGDGEDGRKVNEEEELAPMGGMAL